MKDARNIISSCRHCLFYEMQGRRGGQCRQLGVPVKGCWRSCALAVSPFASHWHGLEQVVVEGVVENIVARHAPAFASSATGLERQVKESLQTAEVAQ